MPNQPLIGIAALGSPVLDLSSRDSWVFGPEAPERRVRQRRLGGLSELYVAVGLQPYSALLAGKLICFCMASKEVVEVYNDAYAREPGQVPLAAIYSLSAYGPKSSQYNRLSIHGRLLYHLAGATEGWSIGHIPDCLVERVAEYLESKRLSIRSALPRKHPSKFHVVHRFLRHIGVRPDEILNTGIRRAIYICPVAKNYQNVLGYCETPEYDVPSLAEAIQWWKWRWLEMRSASCDVMNRVRSFRPESAYTAAALCSF